MKLISYQLIDISVHTFFVIPIIVFGLPNDVFPVGIQFLQRFFVNGT